MRVAILVAALLALPALPQMAAAKTGTARIEVSKGRRTLVALEEAAASQFTIWSGPGTSAGPPGDIYRGVEGRWYRASAPLGRVGAPAARRGADAARAGPHA